MKTSIKEELAYHIIDKIDDGILTNDNIDDWHHYALNEDYYIVYHYNAKKWLEKHNIDVLEAAGICQQYEVDNFGECNRIYDNYEGIVNMLTYIYGEELLYSFDVETVEELREELVELTNNI